MPKRSPRIECPRCKEIAYAKYANGRGYCYFCEYSGVGKKNNYIGIKCPDCASTNVRKKERNKHKKRQRWLCNECGATWWEESQRKVRPEERKKLINKIKKWEERGYSIEEIRGRLMTYYDMKRRTANEWIMKALGRRKKVITKDILLKYLNYKELGYPKETIEKALNFKVKSLEAKLKKYKEGGLL